MSFARQVWDNLSNVNVSQHVEKKNNLSYLSWAWAWGTLMEYYPESVYAFEPLQISADGTVEVWVSVTVSQGEKSLTRQMWLPVMDYRNKAIPNPNTFDLNKTRMRCLTKCLAMFGLGHYIYAGEDLPSEGSTRSIDPAFADRFSEIIKESNALAARLFEMQHPNETGELINSAPDGQKTKLKKTFGDLVKEGQSIIDGFVVDVKNMIDSEDDAGLSEFVGDCQPEVKRLIAAQLTQEEIEVLKRAKQ